MLFNLKEYTKDLVELASSFGVNILSDWKGVDCVHPLIELIKRDGGVFIMKIDGERKDPDDNGMYTFVVSGGKLGEDCSIRIDSESLEEGLAYSIS